MELQENMALVMEIFITEVLISVVDSLLWQICDGIILSLKIVPQICCDWNFPPRIVFDEFNLSQM